MGPCDTIFTESDTTIEPLTVNEDISSKRVSPMIDVLRSILIPEEVISSHLSILNSPACCKPSAIMQNLPSSIVQTLL